MASLFNIRVKRKISHQLYIISIRSGHDQIQFSSIKKVNIGRPEHSLTPQPLSSITYHFCLYQSGRHTSITPSGYTFKYRPLSTCAMFTDDSKKDFHR